MKYCLDGSEHERNLVEIGKIPGLMSLLAYNNTHAVVKGLKDFPREERPPVSITFWSFRLMVGLGMLFVLLTLMGWFLRNRLVESPWYLRIMVLAIPLPYLACELGWTVAEVGRQPWIVYGLMKTSDAVSPISPGQVGVSLVAFILLYGFLGLVDFYLLAKFAKKGPEPAPAESN
jgi:cytochrome d ubiquinol oxidase subunit I